MANENGGGLKEYCLQTARRAKAASAELVALTGAQKNDWLHRSARLLNERVAALTEANRLDLAAAPSFGLSPAAIDRTKAHFRSHCRDCPGIGGGGGPA